MKFLAAIIVSLALGACSKGEIATVKDGYLDFDKSATVGQALDGCKRFKKTEWSLVNTDQGRRLVTFVGDIDLANVQFPDKRFVRKTMTIQFAVTEDGFEFYAGKLDRDLAPGVQLPGEVDGKYSSNLNTKILHSIYANKELDWL